MVKRDGAETRRERISQIARIIQAALFQKKDNGEESDEISFQKTVGAIMYETGLTREKVVEYLEVIEVMGQIELDVVNDKVRKPGV
jgi:hypothetical protein